ncbi:MAG TPA: invasion associated locus B family protein [Candidatus Omnitrophota bacterium]|nr:invasion associated locus B family protein [Candidatus Omnitrophota bacterium]
MRHTTTVLAAAMIAGLATGAGAAELGRFGQWEAYVLSDASGKFCYAAARADKLQGGDKNRVGTALAVSHRAKSPNEVSVTGPYGFKKDSDVEIQIGGMKHTLFTKGGQNAWAKDGAADKAIVAAMAKGKEVLVRATPAKGAAVSDSIPLKGFSDALAAIDKACGVKR